MRLFLAAIDCPQPKAYTTSDRTIHLALAGNTFVQLAPAEARALAAELTSAADAIDAEVGA